MTRPPLLALLLLAACDAAPSANELVCELRPEYQPIELPGDGWCVTLDRRGRVCMHRCDELSPVFVCQP